MWRFSQRWHPWLRWRLIWLGQNLDSADRRAGLESGMAVVNVVDAGRRPASLPDWVLLRRDLERPCRERHVLRCRGVSSSCSGWALPAHGLVSAMPCGGILRLSCCFAPPPAASPDSSTPPSPSGRAPFRGGWAAPLYFPLPLRTPSGASLFALPPLLLSSLSLGSSSTLRRPGGAPIFPYSSTPPSPSVRAPPRAGR